MPGMTPLLRAANGARTGGHTRCRGPLACVFSAVLALACDGVSSDPSASPGALAPDAGPGQAQSPPGATASDGSVAGSPQVPPTGQVALEAWLAAGHYKTWACETGISPPRLNGAHGRHRICSNRALLDAVDATGAYPVGAASVKELFTTSNGPNGYAVGVKVAPGLRDDTWYWYERTGTSASSRPVADSVGDKVCGAGCHAAAPRDNVFIRAPR